MLSRTSLVTLFAVLAICSAAQGATLTTLYSFCSASNCADGADPSANLLRDGNGNLFGTTFYGGTAAGQQGSGVVFELSPGHHGTWQYSNLYTFCKQSPCTDGRAPDGDLIIDTSGNLYGETAFSAQDGLIFELSPAAGSWSYNVLHDFSGPDGSVPSGGLRYVGFTAGEPYDGVSPLYGLTDEGGPIDTDVGTAYQLVPNAGSWTLTTINSFSGAQNAYGPVETVTLDASGTNMYGVTLNPDGGTVFQLTDAGGGTWNETTLYTFDPLNNDHTNSPFGAPFLDASGSLIGTASRGGPHCSFSQHHGEKRCGGGVFKLSGGSSNPTYDAIYDFCGSKYKNCEDGHGPGGSLVMDPAGNLYGVTVGGGKYNSGTIFRIRREQKLEVIYDFCSLPSCSDGLYPSGGLTLDSKGHLYGLTSEGGANNGGTVFEFTP